VGAGSDASNRCNAEAGNQAVEGYALAKTIVHGLFVLMT
jgi:hypothetical protein